MLKSIALFVLAALLEIGGAWLVWQGGREHRGWLWVIADSLACGMIADGFRPDRWDVAGAIVSLIGVGLIMYTPR